MFSTSLPSILISLPLRTHTAFLSSPMFSFFQTSFFNSFRIHINNSSSVPFIQTWITAYFTLKQLKCSNPNQFHSTREQVVPLQSNILPDGTSIGASFGCQQSSDGKGGKSMLLTTSMFKNNYPRLSSLGKRFHNTKILCQHVIKVGETETSSDQYSLSISYS